MASAQSQQPSFKMSDFQELASGLNYPEGPVWRADGSLLVVEIGGGVLTRIARDGVKSTVATLGGGPNGAAVGPDGAIYICNDGGLLILPAEALAPHLQGTPAGSLKVAVGQGPANQVGSIQRVSQDGAVTTLYTQFQATNPFTKQVETLPLRSPDDLAFDRSGSFWFTDWGKDRWRDRDITGVYYARPDGSSIEEKIFPLKSPNGIGLSPDETRLYVAESFTRRILFWELSAPGVIKPNPKTLDGAYLLTAKIPFEACLDSMTLDEQGNIYAAGFLPHGADPSSKGGIAVISPDGEILDWIEIDVGQPDPLPSNLCFGGPDRRTLYITLSGTGRVVTCEMRVAGKNPVWE